MKKKEMISSIKANAESAKIRLIGLLDELEEIGARREARSLEMIIKKLEIWQNK